MRIAIVSTLLPPNVATGGTEAPLRQAVALAGAGHDVGLLSGRADHGREPLELLTTTIAGLPATQVVTTPWLEATKPEFHSNPSVTPVVEAFAAAFAPDVAHCHSLQGLGLETVPTLAAHCPVVVQMHDFWWCCDQQFLVTATGDPCIGWFTGTCTCAPAAAAAPSDGIRARLEALRSAALILAPCATTAEWIASMVRDGPRIEVGGQPAAATGAVATRGGDGATRFLYLGGANAQKGWLDLIDAAWALHERETSRPFSVECAGVPRAAIPPPLRATLVPRPRLSRQEVDAAYSRCDVVLVPSRAAETYGYVAREALGAGVRVIATDGPGMLDLARAMPAVTVVPRGRPDHLAAAMREAVELEPPPPAQATTPPEPDGRLADALLSAYARILEESR